DLKDFSSGWPKNWAESPRFHVDRGWTSRGHGRKRGTEGGNLGDFDLRSCAFSLIGRLVMRVKRHARSEGWKSIRCLSKATPARPYACRFSSLRRWIKPSVGPLLHARVSPACTADSSLCR